MFYLKISSHLKIVSYDVISGVRNWNASPSDAGDAGPALAAQVPCSRPWNTTSEAHIFFSLSHTLCSNTSKHWIAAGKQVKPPSLILIRSSLVCCSKLGLSLWSACPRTSDLPTSFSKGLRLQVWPNRPHVSVSRWENQLWPLLTVCFKHKLPQSLRSCLTCSVLGWDCSLGFPCYCGLKTPTYKFSP